MDKKEAMKIAKRRRAGYYVHDKQAYRAADNYDLGTASGEAQSLFAALVVADRRIMELEGAGVAEGTKVLVGSDQIPGVVYDVESGPRFLRVELTEDSERAKAITAKPGGYAELVLENDVRRRGDCIRVGEDLVQVVPE